MTQAAVTDFDRIGGEPVVRAIIDRFVDRLFGDMIVGFFFAGKDAGRVKTHEYEHAARTLGADIPYTGRPIAPLHRPLRINGGQFRRRLAILKQEIDAGGVAPDIAERWLAEQRAMQTQITDGTDCAPEPTDA